jgi:hypothetical protein
MDSPASSPSSSPAKKHVKQNIKSAISQGLNTEGAGISNYTLFAYMKKSTEGEVEEQRKRDFEKSQEVSEKIREEEKW